MGAEAQDSQALLLANRRQREPKRQAASHSVWDGNQPQRRFRVGISAGMRSIANL